MKKTLLAAAAVLALGVGSASAADMAVYTKAPPAPPAPPWDIAFGTAFVTDYNWRGVTQSNHNAAVQGYFEPQVNITPDLQLYVGLWGSSLWTGAANAEFDIYGGLRYTIGPVTLDGGVVYYDYPGATAFNFYELYFKPSWAVNDWLSVGANFFYSGDFANAGFDAYFLSGTAKVTAPGDFLMPGVGAYISGEVGTQQFDTVLMNDYMTWNLGVGLTYKAMTVEVRYYDSDLSTTQCAFNGGFANITPTQSNFCDERIVGKISFDTTLNSIK